jgi:hypothetical protein
MFLVYKLIPVIVYLYVNTPHQPPGDIYDIPIIQPSNFKILEELKFSLKQASI